MQRYTKEELAKRLDGRECGSEVNSKDKNDAVASGLVIVIGYSDDNVEFWGAIDDEVGAYNGTTILLTKDRILPAHDDCECEFCGYKAIADKAAKIEAVWDNPDAVATWTFETAIPHATFMVKEDGENFCQGIVFSINDLP